MIELLADVPGAVWGFLSAAALSFTQQGFSRRADSRKLKQERTFALSDAWRTTREENHLALLALMDEGYEIVHEEFHIHSRGDTPTHIEDQNRRYDHLGPLGIERIEKHQAALRKVNIYAGEKSRAAATEMVRALRTASEAVMKPHLADDIDFRLARQEMTKYRSKHDNYMNQVRKELGTG